MARLWHPISGYSPPQNKFLHVNDKIHMLNTTKVTCHISHIHKKSFNHILGEKWIRYIIKKYELIMREHVLISTSQILHALWKSFLWDSDLIGLLNKMYRLPLSTLKKETSLYLQIDLNTKPSKCPVIHLLLVLIRQYYWKLYKTEDKRNLTLKNKCIYF